MKIHSNKLQRIFKYLTPSIGSPLKMAEFNSFLFDVDENGLMVRIYNGTTESIVNLAGEFEPIRFAVDEFIYQLVNQLNGEISFALDGTNLLVDCGNKHYEFSTIDCELWQPIMTQQAVEPFDIKNVRLFNKVHHAIATDESRSIYCNYHIRDGQLFTSDGFRAITTPINLADNSFAQKEFDSILRCLDGDVYYNFDDNIYFRCESDEFVIKYMTSGIEGEPFDAQKIFAEKEANEPLVTIVFDNLQNNLKDILVMQKQASKLGESAFLLTIRYDEFGLYFCTHITGLSNSEQKIDSDVTGEQFEFHINPVYLNDFAKVADGKITIKYIGPMGPILLYDESESKSLIMPMSKIVSR